MSQQIYWAVLNGRSWPKQKFWPLRFHKIQGNAGLELIGHSMKNREKYKMYIKRFIMKSQDAIHYDVYEHQTKMIRK